MAQTFSIDGQLRTRGEYRNSVFEDGNDYGQFINERVRIGMTYDADYLTVKFSGQHCGVWGQGTQNPINYGDFNVNEAWAQLNFGQGFYTKFGRQALVYDDERLLGGLDWHIAGRSHDAAKVGFASGAHKVDVILAYNSDGQNQTGKNYYSANGQPYKCMHTVWYHYQAPSSPFAASLIFLTLGFQQGTSADPSDMYQHTMGTYVTYKPGKLALEGSFYYQMTDRTSSAFMAAIKATYKTCDHAAVAAGVDYLSGNQGDGTHLGFNPLYGTHHKFYGLMDYYNDKTIPTYGLIDPYISVTGNFTKTLNCQLTYHAFLNDTDGGLTSGPVAAKSFAASELDLQLTWKFKKDVTIMGGWSLLSRTPNNPTTLCQTQNWVWIQLNVNPRLFFARF